MTIIDKRKSGKNKSIENRQRFIKRYKEAIKRSISDSEEDINISEPFKGKRKVKIDKKDISEPEFSLDRSTGKTDRVLPGNKKYQVGDKISKPSGGKGKGYQGSDSGESEDSFTFVLSKKEFIELYFDDMELPDFIKKSFNDNPEYKMVRSGYSKDGTPPKIDLLKTFKQSIARRIATGKMDRFLDEIDLRYKYYVKKPFPVTQAYVIFLMDVSGSMEEHEKTLAKKFFILLYLFLEREYERIEITFVRHTTEAWECSEEEFFYTSKQSGGTLVSSGLAKVNDIIDERININEVNVYVAHASDGDNFAHDWEYCTEEMDKLLPKIQYFAYVQVETESRATWKTENGAEDLFDFYSLMYGKVTNKIGMSVAYNPSQVYPALKNLFTKGNTDGQ